MKRNIRRLICLLFVGVLFFSAFYFGTDAAESNVEDYGFRINGRAINANHTSGKGYSYNPTTNTLTLTEDFETNWMSICNDYLYNQARRDYVNNSLTFFLPTINLKQKTSITIVIDGDVNIGSRGESRKTSLDAPNLDAPTRSYGIFGNDCHITLKSAAGKKGKLTIETIDSGIYCDDLDIIGLDVDVDTSRTSAMYIHGRLIVKDNSNVELCTQVLGSFYQTRTFDDGDYIYRYDSMATLYVGDGSTKSGRTDFELSNSNLYVEANFSGILDSSNDLRKESDNADMDEKMEVYESGEWQTVKTTDTRLYNGIYVNGGKLQSNNSTLHVNIKGVEGVMGTYNNIRNDVHGKGTSILYRAVGINARKVVFNSSDVKVEMNAEKSDSTFEFGHDPHAFYNMSYYDAETSSPNGKYSRANTEIEISGDTDLLAYIEHRLTNVPATHSEFAASRQWRALDFENEALFDFPDNAFYQVKYTLDNVKGDLCLYRRIVSYKKDTVYLRKNGNSYQYSNYFDFRDVKNLANNVVDASNVGWEDKAFYVKSGDFNIKPVKRGLKLTVCSDSSARLLLEGGKNAPYEKFDIAVVGNVYIEGDGYMKDLVVNSFIEDSSDAYPDGVLMGWGKLYLYGGTAETGRIDTANISCCMEGGNYNFTNDKISFFVEYNGNYNYSTCQKYYVDLGEYASLFDYNNFTTSISTVNTGTYPINNRLYDWRNPDAPIIMTGNPINFHHFTYRDDDKGYDSYVFPQQGENGNYTVYRLQEREVYELVGPSNYYATGWRDDVELKSFYYSKVYDMPGKNPFRTSENYVTETEIPGTGGYTPPSGVTVEWGCLDKNNNRVKLNTENSMKLSIEKIDYDVFNGYHDYYCRVTGGGANEIYYFNLRVLGFSNPVNQIAGDGETACFKFEYGTTGNWLEEDGFEWGWEWRENEQAEFKPIANSEAETYEYTAFFNSADDNSHGYQFRRVATLNTITPGSIKLCSDPATLQMGAKVVTQPNPEKIVMYTTDKRESISFSVQYKRGQSAYVQTRPLHDALGTPQLFTGADMSYVTDVNGITTVTVTFNKSKFSDASGNWDPTKMSAAFRIAVVGGSEKCSDGYIEYNDDYSNYISIIVQEMPKFNTNPASKMVLKGDNVVVETTCSNLLWDDPDSSMWWEYSTDNGNNWVKVTETSSEKPVYIENIKGVAISLGVGTIGGIGGSSHQIVYVAPTPYQGSNLYINDISLDMDGVQVRSIMQDGSGALYYSSSATLTVLDFPQITQQLQSQTVNVTKQSTATLGFAFGSAIPDGYTVNYQWQKTLTNGKNWRDITSGSSYTCNDASIYFPNISALEETAYYRCNVTITKEGVGSLTITTDVAELIVVHNPKFTTNAPTASTTELSEGDPLTINIAWDISVNSIKWQVNKDGVNWVDFTDTGKVGISNRSSWVTFNSVTPEMTGWKFRCVIVKSAGSDSNTVYSGGYTVPLISSECEGTGTESDPYLIKNAGNLYWFAQKVNSGSTEINGKLMANIAVNLGEFSAGGKNSLDNSGVFIEWIPIGNYDVKYAGTFDGNGKTVSGLYYNYPTNQYVGLFGYITADSTVKNVSVENSYFNAKSRVGSIVGANNGSVTGCTSSVIIESSTNNSMLIGGIVGENYGAVTNCSSSSTVTLSSDSSYSGGGVVGGNYEAGRVENCFNTGSVKGFSNVGGVAGENSGELVNCYNTGIVKGDAYNVGGIAGISTRGVIINCYYLTGCAEDRDKTLVKGIGASYGSISADVDGATAPKTSSKFASGEVAYLLQGGVNPETTLDDDGNVFTRIPYVWGQKSSTDGSLPILTSNEAYTVLPVMDGGVVVNYSVLKTGETNDDGVVDIYDYQNSVNIALSDNNLKTASEKYDLNGDGVLDVLDISLAEQSGMSEEELGAFGEVVASADGMCYIKNADLDGDGVVDVLDISLLERLLAGHKVQIGD